MKPIARPKPSWREIFSPKKLPKGGGIFLSKGPQNRGESPENFLFFCWRFVFERRPPNFFFLRMLV